MSYDVATSAQGRKKTGKRYRKRHKEDFTVAEQVAAMVARRREKRRAQMAAAPKRTGMKGTSKYCYVQPVWHSFAVAGCIVYVGGEDADGGGGAMAEAVLAAADAGESSVGARGSCDAEPVVEQCAPVLAVGWFGAANKDAAARAPSKRIKLGNEELPCIGSEIEVHWAEEGQWFRGHVEAIDETRSDACTFQVHYGDGDIEWEDLKGADEWSHCEVEAVEVGGADAEAVGVGEGEADAMGIGEEEAEAAKIAGADSE